MEISGKTHVVFGQANTLAKDDASRGSVAPTDSGPHAKKDTVALSAKANQIRKLVHTANSLPEVREDKVAEMKRRIASGTYRIMHEKVASQLIGEAMENNEILNHIDDLDEY